MGHLSLVTIASDTSPRIAKLGFDMPCALLVVWQDGTQSRHDLSPAIASKKWAAPLADATLFRSAVIEDDGWQIVWPGTDLAFSAEGLWQDMHPPAKPAADWMSAQDFAGWMRAMEFTYERAAEALGTSPRMLKYYASGKYEVPKAICLACMHLSATRSRDARR